MTLPSIGRWLLVLILTTTGLVHAQQGELSTESQRAIRYYYKGSESYRLRDYHNAEADLQQAVAADDQFSEAYMVLGDLYTDQKNYEKAIVFYGNAITKGRRLYPQAYFYMAKLQHKSGRYEEAITNYGLMLQNSTRNDERRILLESLISDCRFAIEQMQHPLPFNPQNLGSAVNTSKAEYFPCLTVDGQTLLFTRREKAEGENYEQEDFYMSTRSDSGWQTAHPVGIPINTRWNEGAPTLSPDGQYIIFTACANAARDYGPDREGYGSCDLFASRRMGSGWTEPVNLGTPVNSGYWETQPSFASDGRTLYFVRGYRDKQGESQQDIFTSEMLSDGQWSVPVKLPDVINSAGREESVFIHPDGRTLYFSSDGHQGMGGLDIFMSRRHDNGEWSKPVNLGYPINTWRDENSLLVSGDGKLGYFASDRQGGFGSLDLYSFEMPDTLRPQRITYLRGTVYDALSNQKLEARFELINLLNNQVVVSSVSNPLTGEFLVALPSGKTYALNVSRKGYLFYSDHFDFAGDHGIGNPFLRDVPLQPITVGKSVVLKNVFFDTDSFNLQPESRAELDRLAMLLDENPNMKIEIGGHTDSQGNDAYNLELSLNRARAVFDYLAAKATNPKRLTYAGYGETTPVADNTTENGRAQNRRTAFRVMGL